MDVKFKNLPWIFVETYQQVLLAWARDLVRIGSAIEVDLHHVEGPAVDMAAVPQKVKLGCQVWKHPKSGDVRFLIQPLTEMDVAIVAGHCEQLPRILELKRLEAAKQARSQGHMDAVFDDIPDEFVQAYQRELREWGFAFKQLGRNHTIPLRKVPGVSPDFDDEGREVQYGVALVAEVDRAGQRTRLIIRPKDEQARERIARHVADIKRHGDPMAAASVH
jgi:hypothetical protein